jgi:hypothetical protein
MLIRAIGQLAVIATCLNLGAADAQTSHQDGGMPDSPPVEEYCAEACHRWLMESLDREVIVDVHPASTTWTFRVQYAADWISGEPCPKGRVAFARGIVTTKNSGEFLNDMLLRGFCPRVVLNGVSAETPYLKSRVWDDVVFDFERARLLTRRQYEQFVVPPLKLLLSSEEPSRWVTFGLFVRGLHEYADLLTAEIRTVFADPYPSKRQETPAGGSSKAANVAEIADWVTTNSSLVDALLDDLDSNRDLSSRPGYKRLIDNLAGITSSVPTWGSPPVCANVNRIAKYLPWGQDIKRDATFLATLSRCDAGSEDLLRKSFLDTRPAIVATGVRVWWAGVASRRPAVREVAQDLVALIMSKGLPDADASPVYEFSGRGQMMIKDGAAIEEASLGLSSLGLLSETVDRLNSAGRQDEAQALFKGLELGLQRLSR